MDSDIRETGLTGDPKRQAVYALRGYLYQIWHTVFAWLDLKDNEVLFIEGSEDFDIAGPEKGTAVQVKDTANNITLRTPEVVDAICHYWQLRNANPQVKVLFRYLTRSSIGVERGEPFGTGVAGLDLWRRCGREPEHIETIRHFILDENRIPLEFPELKEFLDSADSESILRQLILPISWEVEQESSNFIEKTIVKKLILHGEKIGVPPSESARVVDRLLKETLTTACRTDDRSLDRPRFLELFEEATTTRVPNQQLQTLMRGLTIPPELMTSLLGGRSGFSLHPIPLIYKGIPPLYPNLAPRKTQVTRLCRALRETGVLILTSSTGMGKTTLAKLVADAEGGEWHWVSLSGQDASQTSRTLNFLETRMHEIPESPKIVLDDIDFSPEVARHYEDVLGILIFNLIKRRGQIIVTSQKSLPARLSRGLCLEGKSIQITPPFDQAEIEEYLAQIGCPQDGRGGNLAKILLLQTNGHTQLIHARTIYLIENNWPEIKLEDLYKTPSDIMREREQARQLLVDRTENQRTLLYRLSVISGFFRRDQAIVIGDEIEPSIIHSGDVFDALIGPWLERVDDNYYRLSPLLLDAAKQVWPEAKIRDFQVYAAQAIIKCGSLTTLDASNAFFLALWGRSAYVLLEIIAGIMTAPQAFWRSLASHLSLLTSIKSEGRKTLFPENRPVQFMLGLFQLRIAAEMDPKSAPQIIEALDQEFTAPYEPRKLFLGNRLLFALEVLISEQIEVSPKKLVALLSEIAQIEEELEEFRAITSQFCPPEYISGSESARDILSVLFTIIIPRCTSIDYLNDLLESLNSTPEKIRSRLLAGFDVIEDAAVFMIDRAWLQESKLEHPDWNKCLRSLQKTIELAPAWGIPTLAAAAAHAMGVIYDEYLNDPPRAISTIEAAFAQIGPSILLKDRKATVLFHQRTYQDAITIWEEILPHWHPSANSYPTFIFSYRLAGIASTEIGDWEKAAHFFLGGSAHCETLKNTVLSAAYLGDAGWGFWKAMNYSETVKTYAKALHILEQLPDPKKDFGSFWVSKILGNALLWIEHELTGEAHANAEPRSGMCSNPEQSEKIKDLPPTPIDFSWLHLIRIEYYLKVGTEVYEAVAGRLGQSNLPVVRLLNVELDIQRAIRQLQLDQFPLQIKLLEKELHAARTQYALGQKVWEKPIPSDKEVSALGESTVGDNPLIAALLALINAGKDAQKQIDLWIEKVSATVENKSLLDWLSRVKTILSKETHESITIMKDPNQAGEDRLLASLKIITDNSISADDLFYAQVLIFIGLVQSGWAERIAEPISDLLTSQWLNKIQLRANLRSPNLTVPQIENACAINPKGLKKAAQILLAASGAVSVQLPKNIIDQLGAINS